MAAAETPCADSGDADGALIDVFFNFFRKLPVLGSYPRPLVETVHKIWDGVL
jgi:hypothetical protein